MNRIMTPLIAVAALVVFGAGCATKGYVRDEVSMQLAATRGDLEKSDEQLRSEIAKVGESAAEAERIANRTHLDISEMADLALGDADYKEAGRYRVYFDFDSATLREGDCSVLDEVADRIAGERKLVADVYGFADPTGPEEYNYKLGKRRADAVARYLIDRGSLPVARFASVSFGEKYPAHEDPGDVSDDQRRQVLVVLLEKTAPNGEEAQKEGDILSRK